jgi:hypothetical protein
MAKIGRNQSTGRFCVAANGKSASATISDSATGKRLPLKGYGALKGEFEIRKGLDLSKPIAAQAAAGKARKRSAAKAS